MRRAARYYYAQLKNDPTARTAIDVLHTWGIEGKNIVRLGFGFHNNATQGLIREMTGSYSVLQLEEANLVRQTEKGRYRDTMRNSIIIPTVDADGRVVCFDSYVIGEQRFCRYPDTGYFRRDQNLYSYNLAVKSGKKSVIVVTTYEDCFRLIGLGFSNVVSTYSPEITPAQLALLGRAFRAVLLMTGARFDAVGCMEYCRENGLSFDRIDWQGYANAAAYAEENAPAIAEKAEEYERG